MTADDPQRISLSPAVARYLSDAHDRLRRRTIDRLRLSPLILRTSLQELVDRRKRIFDGTHYFPADHGYSVTFRRRLKRSRRHPEGRECAGDFQLLLVSDTIVVVASTLSGPDQVHGPRRFADKAYPLARRPFIPSTAVVRLVEQYARDRGCTVIAKDTLGYHRQSGTFRRDLERQPPSVAAREMAEQGRQVHRISATFRDKRRECYRLSFDRNTALVVARGDPAQPMIDLLLTGISKSMETDHTYAVARAPEVSSQEVVELTFRDDPFDSYDAMRAVCDAIRESDGLNVAVIHLNPYLQAQILDFFTGATIDLLITDSQSISLVPRSGDCVAAIQRIAHTIFHHFGEGTPKRGQMTG